MPKFPHPSYSTSLSSLAGPTVILIILLASSFVLLQSIHYAAAKGIFLHINQIMQFSA